MANTGGFVCYYRVSTKGQGRSGLGLEAQRAAVAQYLNGGDWRIVSEFVEVETAKRADRPELDKALAAARVHRCPLIVSKVDRLTRSSSFLNRLLDANVDVRFADLPVIEGATGRFLLQQMVAVAELEAGMISARTKAALAQAKRRGKQLGGNRGTRPSRKAALKGAAATGERAAKLAADLKPIIEELQANGAATLAAIAAKLNERGIPTARGNGAWTATQVLRVKQRLPG